MRRIKRIMAIMGICCMLTACESKVNTDSLETSPLQTNTNILEESGIESQEDSVSGNEKEISDETEVMPEKSETDEAEILSGMLVAENITEINSETCLIYEDDKDSEGFSLDFGDIPENNYCLTVSEGGEVIFVSDKGRLSGSDTYIKKIEKLYTGVPRQIILNNSITVLGEDGKLYSEFEINENIPAWTTVAGLGNVLLKMNEIKNYVCINSTTFPKLQLMVLTDEGKVIGCTYESLRKKGAVIYSLEEERITNLSGQYVLTEAGNVYKVNISEGCLE